MANGRVESSKPARIWIGTIPIGENHQDFDSRQLLPGVRYCKGQQEVGAGGFRHWQLVIHLERPQRLSWLKSRVHATAHWEVTRSSAAEEYVWKDDTAVAETRFELGERPFKRNSKTDWERVLASAKEGKLNEIPADVLVRNYSSLVRIRSDNVRPVGVEKIVKVFWGPTGTGKSRTAWEQAGMDAYPKDPLTKWWDGYQGEENVVIDEFRGIISIAHLLRWFDRYPVRVEVKGSCLPLTCKAIWITSNLNPTEWYQDADVATKDALMRRLEIFYME